MKVGIDLGTTNAAIGYVNAQGVPALVPDLGDSNRFATPSIVHVGAEGCLVGQVALDHLEEDPRLAVVRLSSLKLGEEGAALRDHRGRDWPP